MGMFKRIVAVAVLAAAATVTFAQSPAEIDAALKVADEIFVDRGLQGAAGIFMGEFVGAGDVAGKTDRICFFFG